MRDQEAGIVTNIMLCGDLLKFSQPEMYMQYIYVSDGAKDFLQRRTSDSFKRKLVLIIKWLQFMCKMY